MIANGDVTNPDPNQPSEIVEITQKGGFVGEFSTFAQEAAPFGIGVGVSGTAVTVGVVNDDTNPSTSITRRSEAGIRPLSGGDASDPSEGWACQNSALPGVRGNGITSRILTIPVT